MAVLEVVGVWAGVVAISALGNAGVARLVRHRFSADEHVTDQYRLLFGVVVATLVVTVGLFVAVSSVGLSDAFPTLFSDTQGTASFADAITADALELGLFGYLVVSATYVSFTPFVLVVKLSKTDESARAVLISTIRRLAFVLGGIFALAGIPVLVALFDLLVLVPLLPIPLGLALVLVIGAHRRRAVREQFGSADPTDEERELVDSVVAETGFDPERIRLVPTQEDENLWRPWSSGFGRFYTVYLPRQSFEDYSTESLRALLLLQTGSGMENVYRVVAWGGFLSLLTALIGMNTEGLGAALFLVGSLVAFVWPFAWYRYGVRRAYSGDDAVAAIVGADVLYRALEQQQEQFDGDGLTLLRIALLAPSTEKRLARLDRRVA